MKLAELVALYLSRTDGPARPGTGWDPDDHPAGLAAGAPGRLGKTAPLPTLPPLISGWPAEWREVFEERAAIMEFEANLARADAETRAAEDVRRVYGRQAGNHDATPPGGDGHHGAG